MNAVACNTLCLQYACLGQHLVQGLHDKQLADVQEKEGHLLQLALRLDLGFWCCTIVFNIGFYAKIDVGVSRYEENIEQYLI